MTVSLDQYTHTTVTLWDRLDFPGTGARRTTLADSISPTVRHVTPLYHQPVDQILATDALENLAAKRYTQPLDELLGELAGSFGVRWVVLATAVGVSVPAIRKWRQGGDITDDNRMQVATVLALCERRAEITDDMDGDWLGRSVWPDTGITPAVLLSRGLWRDVLSWIEGYRDTVWLLDTAVPQWKNLPRPSSGVQVDGEGTPVIHQAAD